MTKEEGSLTSADVPGGDQVDTTTPQNASTPVRPESESPASTFAERRNRKRSRLIQIVLNPLAKLLMGLGWLDRFLAPLVLLAMILGVIIGQYPPPHFHHLVLLPVCSRKLWLTRLAILG